MVVLELQYFEIMDRDFTAVEARLWLDETCPRLFRNFDSEEDSRSRYANQCERFSFPDETAALAFIESNRGYQEIPRPSPAH